MKYCRTCIYWDSHSTDMQLGDCRAPGEHRFSRVRMRDGTFAMLDSFGPEETRAIHTCGAHVEGDKMEIPPYPPSEESDEDEILRLRAENETLKEIERERNTALTRAFAQISELRLRIDSQRSSLANRLQENELLRAQLSEVLNARATKEGNGK